MPDQETFAAFSRLIKKGDLIAVRAIVNSGVNPDLRNQFGWTPLMLAAANGCTPIVSHLLSAGADIQAVNDFGASALAYAALGGHCQTVQVLLEAGAAVDVRPHGCSLLEFAERGAGRFKSQNHFVLLHAAGAK